MCLIIFVLVIFFFIGCGVDGFSFSFSFDFVLSGGSMGGLKSYEGSGSSGSIGVGSDLVDFMDGSDGVGEMVLFDMVEGDGLFVGDGVGGIDGSMDGFDGVEGDDGFGII